MANIAIIPARGGSKRIPRKNIKEFLGVPIISYSIKAALKSMLFDEIMVSTDDEEIGIVAEKYGAIVPFFRSKENASDHATLSDVISEVVHRYSQNRKYFDNVCCILPTAPFITSIRIFEAFEKMKNANYDSVFPVVEFSYPIFRALEIDDNYKLKMIWPEHLKTRSQDFKPSFHDSGSFYWIRTHALCFEKTLLCNNGSYIILPETEVQDIDTETDWKLAEMKYKLLNVHA